MGQVSDWTTEKSVNLFTHTHTHTHPKMIDMGFKPRLITFYFFFFPLDSKDNTNPLECLLKILILTTTHALSM